MNVVQKRNPDDHHRDYNAMALVQMKPVGGRGGVVRSRSQPLQNYHLAARHDPPVKPRKLQYLSKSQKTKFQKHLPARHDPPQKIIFCKTTQIAIPQKISEN